LHQAGNAEYELAEKIIRGDGVAGGLIALPEVFCRYAVEDSCDRRRLGSSVGRAYAVLVQTGRPTVADENYAVGERLLCTLNADAGGTPAEVIRGLPVRRHALLDLRTLEKRLYQLLVDVFS
jgi:hypothetical protein